MNYYSLNEPEETVLVITPVRWYRKPRTIGVCSTILCVFLMMISIIVIFSSVNEISCQQQLDSFKELNNRKTRNTESILFLGDSITKGWGSNFRGLLNGSTNYTNLGINGDTTCNTQWELSQGLIDNSKANTVILNIGTNDVTLGIAPRSILNSISNIVYDIQAILPQATIVVMNIFPRDELIWNYNSIMSSEQLRSLLRLYFPETQIKFIDTPKSLFLYPNGAAKEGVFTEDGLHLDEKGYIIWKNLLIDANIL